MKVQSRTTRAGSSTVSDVSFLKMLYKKRTNDCLWQIWNLKLLVSSVGACSKSVSDSLRAEHLSEFLKVYQLYRASLCSDTKESLSLSVLCKQSGGHWECRSTRWLSMQAVDFLSFNCSFRRRYSTDLCVIRVPGVSVKQDARYGVLTGNAAPTLSGIWSCVCCSHVVQLLKRQKSFPACFTLVLLTTRLTGHEWSSLL